MGSPTAAAAIPFEDGVTEVQVLPLLAFTGGSAVCSSADPLPLGDFVAGLGGVPQVAQRQRQPAPAKKVDTDLLENYPWLAAYAQGEGEEATSSSAGLGSQEGAESSPLGDGEMEAVFCDLELRRKEWAQTYEPRKEDFKTTLRGGAWTKAHKGV
eukprot:4840290-Alexandrium_andersonii.AAC.1